MKRRKEPAQTDLAARAVAETGKEPTAQTRFIIPASLHERATYYVENHGRKIDRTNSFNALATRGLEELMDRLEKETRRGA